MQQKNTYVKPTDDDFIMDQADDEFITHVQPSGPHFLRNVKGPFVSSSFYSYSRNEATSVQKHRQAALIAMLGHFKERLPSTDQQLVTDVLNSQTDQSQDLSVSTEEESKRLT